MALQQSLLRIAVVVSLLGIAVGARAEPLLVTLEASGALPLTAPQNERFGPGGSAALGLLYPLAPALLIGLRARAGLLTEGDPPQDPGQVDYELGGLDTASVVVRLRPLAGGDGVRRATGLFIEGAAGGGFTGDLQRGVFEAGIGFGISLGDVVLAPAVRYQQVLQPADPISGEDARLLLAGIELTFLDAEPVPVAQDPEPPSDRDKDGLADIEDECPDDPEDMDGHADADGCPDPDNDEDGIKDVDDSCPDDPEDFDEFEDADGCPDPDNDEDGFLDADDQCPNEAEIVNGNKDYDGCPDEGLIEMKDDRIVLEERVLFDLERARVKRAARPILRAIVNLQAQHPEWVRIRIEGHADARGVEDYNQRLSERRAANVRKMLVRLGIPANLIDSAGYGSGRLRDKRDEEEAHQRNRRVEFVVLARRGDPEPEEEAAPEEAQGPAVPDWEKGEGAVAPEASPAAQPEAAEDGEPSEAQDEPAGATDGGAQAGGQDTAAAEGAEPDDTQEAP